MKEIIGYIRKYLTHVNKKVFVLCSIQTAILIYLNYSHHLEKWIISLDFLPWPGYSGHFLIFILAFTLPYFFYWLIEKKNYFLNKPFAILLVVAAAIFALKMAMNTNFHLSTDGNWNEYWNQILYWPIRVVILTAILFLVWWWFDPEQPFYGLTTKNLNWRPYVLMLLIMLPLIAVASTQKDFLMMYPKLQASLSATEHFTWFHKFLFELSYGTDFFSIEIFFRGFLILAFIKWVGNDAILPMACFYCTIHFGKPLGECISSYFGGLILGIVVYNTRMIWGGLMVHLGIAWLMEVGGYVGNAFR
jgi:hypothetical protein